jgi:Domain of unknown function (DUF5668)
MKCYHHPEADAVRECRLCGHPLCGQCSVEVQQGVYCRDCLESRLQNPPASASPVTPPDRKSPKVAGWLSIIPGLGLVYLGQYLKALVVWVLFMGACHLSERSDVGGPLGAFLWFAQIFYAVQEARRINRARAGAPQVEEESGLPEKESPLWGGILIGIGTLLLLDQFDLIRFGELFETFWPVLIIVLGLQILLRGRSDRRRAAGS